MPSSRAERAGVAEGPEFKKRLTALVGFRTIAASLILVVAAAQLTSRRPTTLGLGDYGWFAVVGTDYLLTLITSVIIRRGVSTLRLAWAQVFGGVAFATSIVLLTQGHNSPFWFTFLLAIIGGALVLGRRGALGGAAASTIATIGLTLWSREDGELSLAEAGTQVLAQALVATLSGYVAEQLLRTTGRLTASELDLARTSRLRDQIVTTISSGLAVSEPSGTVRFINPAGLAILGLGPQPPFPAVGELFPGLERVRAGRRWETVVSGARGDRILGISTSPLDEPGSMLVVFQDLTELRKKEEEMAQLDRLAQLGRLSATMAHEVRNPLASMRGSAQMLLGEASPGSAQERLSRIIVRESDRLATLVENYLDFARPKPPQRSQVRVDVLVAETVEVLRADPLARGMTLEESVEPREASLDPAQIKQVLINLLRNAFRAAGPRGRVRVIVPSGSNHLFEVWDSGGGIRPEDTERIFEPFTTREPDGTGLGLSTAQSIAQAHGGRLVVRSSPTEGTTFSFVMVGDGVTA